MGAQAHLKEALFIKITISWTFLHASKHADRCVLWSRRRAGSLSGLLQLRLNTCCHVSSWILRSHVCGMDFFQAKECVCVCGIMRNSQPDILFVCLSANALPWCLPIIQAPQNQEEEAECSIVCKSQTLIRTPPDYHSSNNKLCHERRSMWQMEQLWSACENIIVLWWC